MTSPNKGESEFHAARRSGRVEHLGIRWLWIQQRARRSHLSAATMLSKADRADDCVLDQVREVTGSQSEGRGGTTTSCDPPVVRTSVHNLRGCLPTGRAATMMAWTIWRVATMACYHDRSGVGKPNSNLASRGERTRRTVVPVLSDAAAYGGAEVVSQVSMPRLKHGTERAQQSTTRI